MAKAVLVRNGHHQRPMVAVLTRYGIGTKDQYDRGLWISVSDLPKIIDCMEEDETLVRMTGNDGNEYMFVQGTNIHNSVGADDFYRLFICLR